MNVVRGVKDSNSPKIRKRKCLNPYSILHNENAQLPISSFNFSNVAKSHHSSTFLENLFNKSTTSSSNSEGHSNKTEKSLMCPPICLPIRSTDKKTISNNLSILNSNSRQIFNKKYNLSTSKEISMNRNIKFPHFSETISNVTKSHNSTDFLKTIFNKSLTSSNLHFNFSNITEKSLCPSSQLPSRPSTKNKKIYDLSALDTKNQQIFNRKYKSNSSKETPLNNPDQKRVYRSFSTTTNVSNIDSQIIIALTEGRGAAKCEVGMASIDIKRPHIILCQFSDKHSYIHSVTKLNYLNPAEIIVPHTFNSGVSPTHLYRLIRDQFPNIQLITVQRKCFSNSIGIEYIKHLCAPEYLNIQLQLIHKFYALTAVAALLRYVENILCIHFAPHSLKIEYHGTQNSMLIDVETSIRLELVESLCDSLHRQHSLLSILNYTYTFGGLRNLRANILQPSSNIHVINTRLDCIEELLQNNGGLFSALKKAMKHFINVEKILWLCVLLPIQTGVKAGETQLNQILELKGTISSLPILIEALHLAKGNWFHNIKKELEDPQISEISQQINEILQEDAHLGKGTSSHFQRCFAVKPNINGLLDVARKSYSELVNDIQEKIIELGEKYGLPLRMKWTSSKGFHIVLTNRFRNHNNFETNDFPSIFLEVQNHGSIVTMTTEEILFKNHQAKETLNEIQTMSNVIIYDLITDLRKYMNILYRLCENISELDMVLSLAQVSSSSNYVRPTFNTYMNLKDSIHPILESIIPVSPIPNDVSASPEFNFNIITGPNMGGKSIYIKQIALLQIMAQVGCFVPAKSAVFRIADNIFSRIGFNDSIENNASTYVLEMKEMQYILQNVTSSSLIIIDEFCRGTASEEGTAMAWAICEQLLNTNAFTFFTTHFLYLTKLQDVYYNVVNYHTDVERCTDDDKNSFRLIYKHKIIPGVTNIDHYGLILAKNTNIPKSVINLAEDLIGVIERQKKPLPESLQVDVSKITFYQLAAKLTQKTHECDSTLETYNDIFKKFKEKLNFFIGTTNDENYINKENENINDIGDDDANNTEGNKESIDENILEIENNTQSNYIDDFDYSQTLSSSTPNLYLAKNKSFGNVSVNSHMSVIFVAKKQSSERSSKEFSNNPCISNFNSISQNIMRNKSSHSNEKYSNYKDNKSIFVEPDIPIFNYCTQSDSDSSSDTHI